MIFFSARYVHGFARDVGGFVGDQKGDRFGNILRQTRSFQRISVRYSLQIIVVRKPQFFGKKLILPVSQTRRNVVGANGVYADLVLPEFDGIRARQTDESVFGSRVSRRERKPRFGSLRGNIDNRTAAALQN